MRNVNISRKHAPSVVVNPIPYKHWSEVWSAAKENSNTNGQTQKWELHASLSVIALTA